MKARKRTQLQPTKPLLHKHTYTIRLHRTRRHNIHAKPRKESGDFPVGRRVPLPRPSAWSRLAPTPLAVGEPSPALLVRTRGSTTQPALPRLPSVPPWIGRPPNRERRTKTTGTQRRGPRREKTQAKKTGEKDSRLSDDKKLRRQRTGLKTTKSSGLGRLV